MVWQYDPSHRLGSDPEAGLYLAEELPTRDGQKSLIKRMSDDSVVFTFRARRIKFRDLTEEERDRNPNFDVISEWNVVYLGDSEVEKNIIENSLFTHTNRRNGYVDFFGGSPRKSLVDVRFVTRLEGY
jgi:hypothetical protein